MSYKIDPSESEFVYDIENIDEAIRSVSSIKVKPMAIVLSLSTPDMGGSVASLTFEDLKIYMPKGLTATASAGEYDRATGLLSIDRLVARGCRGQGRCHCHCYRYGRQRLCAELREPFAELWR